MTSATLRSLPTEFGRNLCSPLIGTLAAALVLVRWLLPTEGVAQGDQLWLVVLWSLVAGIWLGVGAGFRRPLGPLDFCLALVVAGHLLGGWLVWVEGGHRRVAVNLMAEWWGLTCGWLVLRDFLLSGAWTLAFRRAWLALAVTVSCLGLWQHYYSLPRSAQELGPKIARLRAELAQGETGPTAWEFLRLGLSTTEPGLTLMEKRLRDSREPFGFFALANTLGGLLGASLVWGVVGTLGLPPRRGSHSWRVWVPCWLGWLAMAWCLALTKSRTAWAGVMAGGVLAMVIGCRRSPEGGLAWLRGRAWIALLIVTGLVVGGAAVLWSTGGWDREVLAEAPKSLGYRIQYWRATWRLIVESPWWGVGLGQFREHYLRVKLAEASEEIADPHNLLLDAWVNSGLVGVIGLLGTLAVGLRAIWVLEHRAAWGETAEPVEKSAVNAWVVPGVFGGGLLSFATAFASELIFRGMWDDRLCVAGLVWAGLYFALIPRPTEEAFAAGMAGVVLGVHLLGAGGMGMPAVMLAALVWLGLLTSSQRSEVTPAPWLRGCGKVLGLICLGLAVSIAVVCWYPVRQASLAIGLGDRAAERGDWTTAYAEYQRALKLDPWDPQPAGRLAEAAFTDWQALLPSDRYYADGQAGPFQMAMTALAEARRRHPTSAYWWQREAEYWLALWERTGERQPAVSAANSAAQAVALYPTLTAGWVLWSDAAEAANDRQTALKAARRALEQDDINRRWGHVERVLPETVRRRLERRLENATEPGSPSTALLPRSAQGLVARTEPHHGVLASSSGGRNGVSPSTLPESSRESDGEPTAFTPFSPLTNCGQGDFAQVLADDRKLRTQAIRLECEVGVIFP